MRSARACAAEPAGRAAVIIRGATADDLGTISATLEWAQLPFTDLQPENLRDFLVACAGDGERPDVLGCIGLERFIDVGLLRSLVVVQSARGTGLGAKLVAELERFAAAAGVRELWLLTNDADAYFERFDYEVRVRDDAPAAIRQTEQFSALCPDTAILMSRKLVAD